MHNKEAVRNVSWFIQKRIEDLLGDSCYSNSLPLLSRLGYMARVTYYVENNPQQQKSTQATPKQGNVFQKHNLRLWIQTSGCIKKTQGRPCVILLQWM